jgi:hypothetical protein
MLDFRITIMLGLSVTLVLFSLGGCVIWMIEKFQIAARDRRERLERLIAALERIDLNTRKP